MNAIDNLECLEQTRARESLRYVEKYGEAIRALREVHAALAEDE